MELLLVEEPYLKDIALAASLRVVEVEGVLLPRNEMRVRIVGRGGRPQAPLTAQVVQQQGLHRRLLLIVAVTAHIKQIDVSGGGHVEKAACVVEKAFHDDTSLY